MGWRWDGDESDWDIFIIRLSKSRVVKDFLDAIEESGLDYNQVKNIITAKNFDLESAVYSLTGDNVFWHFGETSDREGEVIEGFVDSQMSLSDEAKEEFAEYFWMKADLHDFASFEEYKKQTKGYSDDGAYPQVENAVRKAFKQANDWNEILNEFDSEDWMYTALEAQEMWMNAVYWPELERVSKMWLKEHPREAMQTRAASTSGQKKLEEVGG